jgi:hypothetical protein
MMKNEKPLTAALGMGSVGCGAAGAAIRTLRMHADIVGTNRGYQTGTCKAKDTTRTKGRIHANTSKPRKPMDAASTTQKWSDLQAARETQDTP